MVKQQREKLLLAERTQPAKHLGGLRTGAKTCVELSICCCCSVARSCLLSATPWTAARQASLSIAISHGLLKLMPVESVMPSHHLALCCPLLLLPSIFPSIRVFSSELVPAPPPPPGLDMPWCSRLGWDVIKDIPLSCPVQSADTARLSSERWLPLGLRSRPAGRASQVNSPFGVSGSSHVRRQLNSYSQFKTLLVLGWAHE